MRSVHVVQTDDDRRQPEALHIRCHHILGCRFGRGVRVGRGQQAELRQVRRVFLDFAVDLCVSSVSALLLSPSPKRTAYLIRGDMVKPLHRPDFINPLQKHMCPQHVVRREAV